MSEEERRETLNEAKILEVLNHPNIVRFREVYKTKKGKLCIVMDYADDGDMQGKIKQRFKTVDRQGRKNYFTEDELLNWLPNFKPKPDWIQIFKKGKDVINSSKLVFIASYDMA